MRASQTLLALAVYVLFAFVQHGEVALGMIDRAESNALTLFNLCGVVAFFVVIRSGFNQRFSADPSLTLPQCLFAMTGIAWSYAITGPARGVIILIMMLVILFGMFALTPRQARLLGAYGFSLLVAVMLWKGLTDPLHYAPEVEVMHFLLSAVVMAAVSVLAIRLGRLRKHLSVQKKDLEAALERIQTMATRDELTGLLNRRAMVELFAREHPRIERGHGPLSIGLLDIDWFKRINDSHGHQVGDAVLKRFGDLLQHQLRAADALARWGGEEFLLLMPGTPVDDARAVLDRLRLRVAEADFTDLAAGLHVSFSAGVALCGAAESREAAIHRADRAMYDAKQAGRNRVQVAAAA